MSLDDDRTLERECKQKTLLRNRAPYVTPCPLAAFQTTSTPSTWTH